MWAGRAHSLPWPLATTQGTRCYHHPHSADGETEARQSDVSPPKTQSGEEAELGAGRAGGQDLKLILLMLYPLPPPGVSTSLFCLKRVTNPR